MRGIIKKVFIVSSVFFVLWLAGFTLFFLSIPQKVLDDHTPTDAIVVLTGGKQRLKTGFQLLEAKRGNLILISGVNPEESLKSILKMLESSRVTRAQDRDYFSSLTHIGQEAKNTKGNAQETAAWIKQQGFTSLRLVTAAYHMPRSLLELKHLLPHTTIIPHPVFPYGNDRAHWLRKEGGLYVILSEYHKYIRGFLRMLLSDG
jgi:uncharacterized SAM-binding protein YcdF (DUF218 family)